MASAAPGTPTPRRCHRARLLPGLIQQKLPALLVPIALILVRRGFQIRAGRREIHLLAAAGLGQHFVLLVDAGYSDDGEL